MKGQAEPIDLIGVAAVVVVIILIAAVFERDIIFEALRQTATFTGLAVARDIAGYLTVAAAAPGDISINYDQNAKFVYTVDIKDHIVDVKITQGGENTFGKEIEGKAETLPDFKKSLTDCNKFIITKTGGEYDITCTKFTPVQ